MFSIKRKRVFQFSALCLLALVSICYLSVVGESEDQVSAASRHLLKDDEESAELANYPKDIFTRKQRMHGGFLLHVLGSLYMFAALAIICDEFFVPALEVIAEKLDLSDDVAGATFMAAGGSAPELATSMIGTFVSESNVGFGTIVGSAVFNILFVIGACAMVATGDIVLTWWPLFRDSTWYAISLGVLIACFNDRKVTWWEAALMFLIYLLYVVFMKYNAQCEKWFKGCLGVKMGGENKEEVDGNNLEMGALNKDIATADEKEEPREIKMHFGIHNLFSSQRGGPMPLKRAKSKRGWNLLRIRVMNKLRADKATKFKQSMSDVVLLAMAENDEKTVSGGNLGNANSPMAAEGETKEKASLVDEKKDGQEGKDEGSDKEGSDKKESEAMDLEWPSTLRKQIAYVILAPLTYYLYYTIPDVRRKESEKWYVVTFLLSIFNIGFFSYFMVWWITLIGDAFGIPSQIMGLTVLAIGTSVPDLLESIIVAKLGKADMSVSSSIGSNIFDVTIGLPIPWLLFTLINGRAIGVGTDGLFVSVILLFAMLVCCITVIALSGWRMSRQLGYIFFFLWVIFVAISLVLEIVVDK